MFNFVQCWVKEKTSFILPLKSKDQTQNGMGKCRWKSWNCLSPCTAAHWKASGANDSEPVCVDASILRTRVPYVSPNITLWGEADKMTAKENKFFTPQRWHRLAVWFLMLLCFRWEICRERKYQNREIWIIKQMAGSKTFGHLLEDKRFFFFKKQKVGICRLL